MVTRDWVWASGWTPHRAVVAGTMHIPQRLRRARAGCLILSPTRGGGRGRASRIRRRLRREAEKRTRLRR